MENTQNNLSKTKPVLVFAGGGTAGHIMPNIALIERLKNDFEICYIGAKNSLEQKIVSEIGFVKFFSIDVVKLIRAVNLKNCLIPFKLLKSKGQAKKILKDLSPNIIFSKGGFVALPVTMAAKGRWPLICHESDISVGLANRLAKKQADYFCTAFDCTADEHINGVWAGLPLRDGIKRDKVKGKARPMLLVMGGSLGANAINAAVRGLVFDLVKCFDVVHIVGKGKICAKTQGEFDRVYRSGVDGINSVGAGGVGSGGKSEVGGKMGKYTQVEFVTDMGEIYSKADVCISRGGATALFELVATKTPSVVIPLPQSSGSRGDQVLNAEYFKNKGLIKVLYQEDLTADSLLKSVVDCFNDIVLKENLKNQNLEDSTEKIARLILEYKNKG